MSAFKKPCPSCGGSSDMEAVKCQTCGRAFGSVEPAREPHDISAAAMLSTLMPGTGQLYNGQTKKGFALLALFVLPLLLGLVSRNFHYVLLMPAAWLLSVIDASIVAGIHLRGEAVSAWRVF